MFDSKLKKTLVALIFVSIIAIGVLPFYAQPVNSSVNSTVLSILPNQVILSGPQPFVVNASVSNVVDLNAWQIEILFNPAILQVAGVTIPFDGIFGLNDLGLQTRIDNSKGSLIAFDALNDVGGVNGSGALCQIQFNVAQPGISSVVFGDQMSAFGTVLYDHTTVNMIPFTANDGFVQVNANGFQSGTYASVKNSVTYNVTIFTNSTVSGYSYSGTNEIMNFTLGGTDGTTGLCTVAYPQVLLDDNVILLINGTAKYALITGSAVRYVTFSYTHSTVKIAIFTTAEGDINGDRKVDMKDIAFVAKLFGTTPLSPNWNPLADLHPDGIIDMRDLAVVAKNYGTIYQPS